MGEETGIAWTDHSYNPWIGCTEIPGKDGRPSACDNCYARELALRRGWVRAWGKDTPRHITQTFREPLKWHRRALTTGIRERVFCLSLGDVLEEHPALPPLRALLWDLIRATPMLDWLLLTKRPHGYRTMLPPDLLRLPSVWPGATVESADWTWRLDALVALDAAGPRWVSYEPALGPVDFTPWLPAVAWVIVGGESEQPHMRRALVPLDLTWARAVIRQCRATGTAPFVKQLGSAFAHHTDPAHFPEDLRVQEFPR